MVFHVDVGVCLVRPPTVQEYRHYVVEADTWVDAQVIATQMASCTSVMPVWAEVVGDEEVGCGE